ncbi:vascular cell adhesion protein 1 isoform X1 [Apteryx mantelli]|uniref:Vascular cell adhesion protein 1 isoform X1 n=1 Tax=Apteryx mantelli TaxID=2696672 RepID=A0A8B7K056_9AVES|nr:PREDICTED: vascular cell adhesion protein 1 isoform X1 [Apteryx mantelli mantelli]
MIKQMERTSQAVIIILYACMSVKAFEMEITPANRIVEQIGETLVLTCNTTGCASPSFSWRIQTDNPLGGTVSNHGTYSTLTMSPVSIENAHDYLCTVFCGLEKKEKSVKVELYSFPSDPVIEISTSLVAGEQTTVICKIPDVYPSDHLEVLLKKEEHILLEKNFFEDDSTNTETKIVTYSFYPTTEDIGKEITCVAKLPIANMDFEPKERVTSQKLNANFGPKNTVITASPSNSAMEGDSLKLTCVTESNPPPQIVWRRQVADKSVQYLVENNVLSIPHAHFTDSGLYICEVINLVTNKTEKATVDIVIQGAPNIAEFSIKPSTTVREGENVSIRCSAESNPPPKIVLRRKSDGADMGLYSEGGILLLPSVTFLSGGDYECVAENKFGKNKSAVALNVEYGPKNTIISVIPAATVKEGETVTMKCTSSGNPAPVISWKKKTVTGESEKIFKDATLTIKNIESQDLGLYECEAYNQFGKEEKAVKLLVQAPPKNTTLSVFPSNAVKQGESVAISCTSTGVPAVQITLRKKIGDVITALETQGGKYTIGRVQLKDAGTYECVSINELGEESQHIVLDVKVPPQNITVLVHPSENVKEGENVTITCSTYSNPPSQMVLKKVHPEKEIILSSVNGTFTLYNVTKNDTGRYLLDVFNEVGNNIKVIEIAVVGRVEKPDQMMPVIIAFSCVTAIAIPVVAILIYVSRKAKINGSYSLVKALRLKV